jgi:ribonuclease P/MRP protein subunit POP5
MVWAALTLISKLPKPLETPVVVKVVRVSATIKKAEEEVIRRARLIVRRARVVEAAVGEGDKMVESVAKSVERRREKESQVLVRVDEGEESESGSE